MALTSIIISSGCHKVLVKTTKYLEDSKLSPSCSTESFNYQTLIATTVDLSVQISANTPANDIILLVPLYRE